ncbi:MAG: succinyl-diaminopimelate desuccinylase [Alphaproteobacteria bacterium]|nr:succinyl-diaminopimelate desuccinylase [Alphaproteobacteria bacterium]
MTDPVDLSARLIRCKSVTPEDGGAMSVVQEVLETEGFDCTRVDRSGIANLFARWGPKGHARTFGFNGHTDVVPVGDVADWTGDPFSGDIRDGCLWGRGAADMKSGVAAFACAAADFVRETPPDGAVILAITGDEEGDAKDGTAALLDWMAAEGEAMSVCLVGEPTCPETMGEMMKIGRRGSMSAFFTATGVQGHAAYPHRAKNPVAAIAQLTHRLSCETLDDGTEHFEPSSLVVTTIDTGNAATNVIPATCRATVNIRFNDLHDSTSLSDWLRAVAAAVASETGTQIETRISVSGESFVTPPGALTDLVASVVEAETGLRPVMSTTGGTSDARFVKTHCPVVEFGLVGQTMHKVDEHVEVAHIHQLKAIYGQILRAYFA